MPKITTSLNGDFLEEIPPTDKFYFSIPQMKIKPREVKVVDLILQITNDEDILQFFIL